MARRRLPRRLAPSLAVAAALLVPGAVVTAHPPGSPTPFGTWDTHLAHMQAMPGPSDAHVQACVEQHGSADLARHGRAMGGMMRETVR